MWDKTFQFNDNGFKALFGILVANTSIGCTLYTVQYTQPAGLWSIENKITKIRKHSITQGSRCNLCFHQICAHLWMSSRVNYRQGETDCDRSTSVNLLPGLLAAGTLLSKTLCLWSCFYIYIWVRSSVWHQFFFFAKSKF